MRLTTADTCVCSESQTLWNIVKQPLLEEATHLEHTFHHGFVSLIHTPDGSSRCLKLKYSSWDSTPEAEMALFGN